MKRLLGSKTYTWVFEHSLLLYLTLAITMVGLFIYVYWAHKATLDIYEKAKSSHELSVKALLLSEENYHTQLEIYEVFSVPDQKRIDDFYLHEKLFNERFMEIYRSFQDLRHEVSPSVMAKFEALKIAIPRIQGQWSAFLAAVHAKKSMKVQLDLLVASEEVFDEENFNSKIKEIVDLQLAEANKADERVKALTRNKGVVIMLGVVIVFLFTCLLALLHRAALRGKTNELQLVQAGKLASLGQLSAGMVHELNSPLMFIAGYNSRIRSVLKKDGYDPKSSVWGFVDEVESAIERLKKIVQHVKDFARLSKNEKQAVPINQIVSRSFVLFEDQLRLSGIAVNLRLSTENPMVRADANRIEQVLLNLIGNARDALNEAESVEKKITVETGIEGSNVFIRLSDTGKGIDPKDQSRIFDPFFTTKPLGLGTGLGLSISAGIIADHQGQLDMESTPNEGSHFTIRLPQLKR